jgi:hypothetical protein
MISRLLIYLSFLSLPGAEELGLLGLTYAYAGFALASPLIVLALRPSSALSPIPNDVVLPFALLLAAFLVLNFFGAQMQPIEARLWLARSVHLIAVPAIALTMLLERVAPDTLFRDLCVVGAIETALIYAAALAYSGADEFRRATDIEGVIVYSVCMMCAGHYALQQFDRSRRMVWLLGYALVLLAAVMTGTRVLMLAAAALLFGLRLRPTTLIGLLLLTALAVVLGNYGFFSRFDLAAGDNLITIVSKLEELQLLWAFFVDSPVFGVGFGKAYQVSVASSPYTYSHNLLMFYLGYAGVIGTMIALFPFVGLAFKRGYFALALSIGLFYTSSTTFTNLKHSLLLVVALLLVWGRSGAPGRSRDEPSARTSKPGAQGIAAG